MVNLGVGTYVPIGCAAVLRFGRVLANASLRAIP